MPFALVTIGLLMIVVGARGTHRAFGAQVAGDFTGPGSFLYWIAAIGSVGALGYIETFRTFSHIFMSLIIIAMFLGNQGFFVKLKEAIDKGPIGQPTSGVVPSAPKATEPAQRTTDLFGTAPAENPGQAKFNGWMNWLTGVR